MHDLSLRTDSFIQDLKRVEQIWFRVVLPALGQMTQEAEVISDEEFEATDSEETAERDPNFDARRILERDWNFYATHGQLLNARQSTVHALFIVLGQIIEQYLIDLLCFLDDTQTSCTFPNFGSLLKALCSVGVNVENTRHWSSIVEIRHIANYLKHGIGTSSEKAKDILVQHIGPAHDPESETTLFSTSQRQYQATLPALPLCNEGIALSEEALAEYFSKTYAFFSLLAKNAA